MATVTGIARVKLIGITWLINDFKCTYTMIGYKYLYNNMKQDQHGSDNTFKVDDLG